MAQASCSINIGDGNIDNGHITSSFNNTFRNFDEDVQILGQLSPPESNDRHQDMRTDRFDRVGD